MKKSAWRLAVAAVLFAFWIGFLGYLIWRSSLPVLRSTAAAREPIVLSRPQFLEADLYVVVEVAVDPAEPGEPSNDVKVKEVIWSANFDDFKLTKLQVKNLKSLAQLGANGWQGSGEYILALSRVRNDEGGFLVTNLPKTPGFEGAPGRIYKAEPDTLKQLEQIKEAYHAGAAAAK
jgi:hypothetical protein